MGITAVMDCKSKTSSATRSTSNSVLSWSDQTEITTPTQVGLLTRSTVSYRH